MSKNDLLRRQREFWEALQELVSVRDDTGRLSTMWQGDLLEVATLFSCYPHAFYLLITVGVPDTADLWAHELMRIARLVQQCVVQGYKCRQYDEHLEVNPKHRRAQVLFHTRLDLFQWLCEQVKAASNVECTAHEPE